eukprot:m.11710 g.11710  ORF g.11710 m.11710 type:complete len:82 (+) comp6638_c0_seq1:280-525(+)
MGENRRDLGNDTQKDTAVIQELERDPSGSEEIKADILEVLVVDGVGVPALNDLFLGSLFPFRSHGAWSSAASALDGLEEEI